MSESTRPSQTSGQNWSEWSELTSELTSDLKSELTHELTRSSELGRRQAPRITTRRKTLVQLALPSSSDESTSSDDSDYGELNLGVGATPFGVNSKIEFDDQDNIIIDENTRAKSARKLQFDEELVTLKKPSALIAKPGLKARPKLKAVAKTVAIGVALKKAHQDAQTRQNEIRENAGGRRRRAVNTSKVAEQGSGLPDF